VHLTNMIDHVVFPDMQFTVNVTENNPDPYNHDTLVLQERDPVTGGVSVIASADVPAGGGEVTISNPYQPNAALNDEFSLQLEGPTGGSDTFTPESGTITAEMNAWVGGSDGTWGAYDGSAGVITFSRNDAAYHDKDIYYTIDGTTVQTTPDGDGAVVGPQLDPATGLYKVTIPAGQSSVSVALTPTANAWYDNQGNIFGDSTQITVSIVSAPAGAPLTYMPPTTDDPQWGPGSTMLTMWSSGAVWSQIRSDGKPFQINPANPPAYGEGTDIYLTVAIPGAGNNPYVASVNSSDGGTIVGADPNLTKGVAKFTLDTLGAKSGDYYISIVVTRPDGTTSSYCLNYKIK
jgi:hypothetical protein